MSRTALVALVGLGGSVSFAEELPQFDPQEMAAARAAMYAEHGNMVTTMIMAERLEWQSHDSEDVLAWEGSASVGPDLYKFVLETEGKWERDHSEFEEFEIDLLYSKAVDAFWNFRTGIRHDFDPRPSRTYLTVGFAGLAPYWFEVDSALYLSETGDISARVEAEYEIRLTQKLHLQPRVELVASVSEDRKANIPSGWNEIDAGFRLRYEITPQFAPYIGVSWSREYDIVQTAEDEHTSFIAGLGFWF